MIVLLKTNNLSLCLNHEYYKSVLQKLFQNNHRKLHKFSLLFIKFSKKSKKNWLWNNVLKKCGFIWNISSYDNKSVSHWIMFDYFFHVWKVNIFFLFNYVPHLFLLTCVKFHGKKINNNDTLTHICLLPFFQMVPYYVT